jgi:FAD-dependent urate hydroxylase
MLQIDSDATARETLRLIGSDPENWVFDHEKIDHNVLVVGGGQSGSTFAFALRRAGIGKVSVIDAAKDHAGAGVWLTGARMHKLRTPKTLPGPELGLPGLSFQAWYEARHGAAAYDALDRIPRVDWAAYLEWYRVQLGITVSYGTRLARIEPERRSLPRSFGARRKAVHGNDQEDYPCQRLRRRRRTQHPGHSVRKLAWGILRSYLGVDRFRGFAW